MLTVVNPVVDVDPVNVDAVAPIEDLAAPIIDEFQIKI